MMRLALGWICFLMAAPLLCAAGETGQTGELPPGTVSEEHPPQTFPAVGIGSFFLDRGEAPFSNLDELKGNFQKLKELRQALQEECLLARNGKEAIGPPSQDNSQLKLRLLELMTKLNAQKNKLPNPESTKPPVPAKHEKPAPPPKTPKQEDKNAPASSEMPTPLNPLSLAQALFKAENFEGALKAYRLIDLKGMKSEERCPIQYMMGACLKRLGKMDEAANLFREVANTRGDENMAVCAQWQISAIRWRKEMQDQLQDIRQRRKSLENQP